MDIGTLIQMAQQLLCANSCASADLLRVMEHNGQQQNCQKSYGKAEFNSWGHLDFSSLTGTPKICIGASFIKARRSCQSHFSAFGTAL